MRIGFVHTVPALAAAFERDLQEQVPDAVAVHVVDADLLSRARTTGVDDEVVARLASHIRHLREEAVDAVLVTCSSLGDATEQAAGQGAPVIRVDAAMAEQAVTLARERAQDRPRVTVLATVAATVGPTTGILRRAAEALGAEITLDVRVLTEALAAREAGDQSRHDALIAEAVADASTTADVIVLAQASMAQAAGAAAATVPILTSPASALSAVIAAARAAR